MTAPSTDALPLEQNLALLHASKPVAWQLGAFLRLDRRLGQFVSQSKEPILTQMRLAWWRDQLTKPVADRPGGDAILDDLSAHWPDEEGALIALVDGWEQLLAEPPLPQAAAEDFAAARAHCFGAIARMAGYDPVNAIHCGARWAFADLLTRMSDPEERAFVLSVACSQCASKLALPYKLRSLAILGKLGQRAIDSGGRPLIAARGDVLHIMRLGLFGR